MNLLQLHRPVGSTSSMKERRGVKREKYEIHTHTHTHGCKYFVYEGKGECDGVMA